MNLPAYAKGRPPGFIGEMNGLDRLNGEGIRGIRPISSFRLLGVGQCKISIDKAKKLRVRSAQQLGEPVS